MFFLQLSIAGTALAGLTMVMFPPQHSEKSTFPEDPPGLRILAPSALPKAANTGEWIAGAVRFLHDGDRIEGGALRTVFDPGELTDGATEVGRLMDAIDYLEVQKRDRNKLKLIAVMKTEENIKEKFMVDDKQVKVTLRHNVSRILVERINNSKVVLKIRGIGAKWGGKPIPESLMRLTIKGDELELVEVAGFDVDPGYDVELPDAFKKEE